MNYDNFKISLRNVTKEIENLDPGDKILKLENVILESYIKGDISILHKNIWMFSLSNPILDGSMTLVDLILDDPDKTVDEFLQSLKLELLEML